MLCYICHHQFFTKKTLRNLFDDEIHFICERCYQRYPLCPRYQEIPISEAKIYYHLLIERNRGLDPMAYMSFLKPYYMDFLKHHCDEIILYVDTFNEQIFEILDILKLGNIYVVSLYENI